MASWYYQHNSLQAGPVDDGALWKMLKNGEMTPETLVWRYGFQDWTPVALHKAELALSAGDVDAPEAAGSAPVMCDECQGVFARNEVISLRGANICARCKPVMLQKLQQGEMPGLSAGPWRRGKDMVISRQNTYLKGHCVKCNQPAEGKRLKRRLYWHHPAWYLLVVFPGVLIYAIVTLCIRKRMKLEVGLCDSHKSRRIWFIVGAWLGIFLGIGLWVRAGQVSEEYIGILVLSGIALFLGGAITGILGARVIFARKMSDDFAVVGGVSRDYLAVLPEWQHGGI